MGREHKTERWASSTSGKASCVTLGSVDFSLITRHNPRLREVTGKLLPLSTQDVSVVPNASAQVLRGLSDVKATTSYKDTEVEVSRTFLPLC